MICSIVITTFNDAGHIHRLFKELDRQVLGPYTKLLVFHCESSELAPDEFNFTNPQIKYNCLYRPNLGRTKAFNLLFNLCAGDFIIRLDARTHINEHYIEDLIRLSNESKCEVVAGVMVPIGVTRTQSNNAKLMSSQIAFGGGKFKDIGFSGYLDSVYLGAFKFNKLPIKLEYDENSHISEDSDFYYRLANAGGKIWQSNNVHAKYFAREKFIDMIRLARNYGQGRALFVIKNHKFGSIRQIIPLAFYVVLSLLLIIGLLNIIFLYAFVFIIFSYFTAIAIHFLKNNVFDFFYLISTTVLIHFFWVQGFIFTYLKYRLKKWTNLSF
ncbi:glycosyltransferase family 2 protein [Planktomarina temperata]|nr:glycosyltransferase family 2 protein [Planktomarina temperata]